MKANLVNGSVAILMTMAAFVNSRGAVISSARIGSSSNQTLI
jgi:hypothetical protein